MLTMSCLRIWMLLLVPFVATFNHFLVYRIHCIVYPLISSFQPQ